jgi:hypothetical protein
VARDTVHWRPEALFVASWKHSASAVNATSLQWIYAAHPRITRAVLGRMSEKRSMMQREAARPHLDVPYPALSTKRMFRVV